MAASSRRRHLQHAASLLPLAVFSLVALPLAFVPPPVIAPPLASTVQSGAPRTETPILINEYLATSQFGIVDEDGDHAD